MVLDEEARVGIILGAIRVQSSGVTRDHQERFWERPDRLLDSMVPRGSLYDSGSPEVPKPRGSPRFLVHMGPSSIPHPIFLALDNKHHKIEKNSAPPNSTSKKQENDSRSTHGLFSESTSWWTFRAH